MSYPKPRKTFADKSDVENAARHLIKIHGATTTLEVKSLLRNSGFLALQADVSRFMQMVAYEQGWGWESGGRFRVYFFQQENLFSIFRAQYSFSPN